MVARGTADTNKVIFSDIYPAMYAYKEHGLPAVTDGPGGCGGAAPGGPPRVPAALQSAFRDVDTDPRKAANQIAAYEQNMVQTRIYDKRPELMSAMKDVQRYSSTWGVSWLGSVMFGLRKPEIPVSAACEGGTPVPLDGDITVAQDRIRYYGKLMNEMERQQRTTPGTLAGTIQTIINRGR